jgi:hypothetical protein
MNYLHKLISDADGEPSTMRVCVLLIVGGFMFVWCWLSIKTGQFAQPPGSMISLLIGALGCKSAQSWAEAGGRKAEDGGQKSEGGGQNQP